VISVDVYPRTAQTMRLIPRRIFFSLFVFWPLSVVRPASILRGATRLKRNATENATLPLGPVGPFGQVGSAVIDGMQLRWSGPDDPYSAKGTFLMLHACGNTCEDWYQLPEEVAIMKAVRQRGFFVVAPQAFTNCWTPQNEGPIVQKALQHFRVGHTIYGLDKKPLFGIGISNGGGMLSYLEAIQGVHFDGHNYIVSAGAAHDNNPGFFATTKFPPSVFVHMVADPYAPVPTIQVASNSLKAQHTPVLALVAPPRPLVTFLDIEIGIDRAVLADVVQQIASWGFDETRKGQTFMKFGHAKLISDHLMMHPRLGPLLLAKSRAVNEELHVLDGVHAPTATHIDTSLNFLLHGGTPQ